MSAQHSAIYRVTALIVLLLGFVPGSAVAQTLSPEAVPDAPPIMTLPFTDFRVKVQQGWYEHTLSSACPGRSCYGVDYVLGEYDTSRTWQQFDVVATHDGEACANCGGGIGNFVKVTYKEGDVVFFSYYGHLAEIASKIPNHKAGGTGTVLVNAGEYLGRSGDTGAEGLIHLHFVAFQPETYDPYGLSTTRAKYYPGGTSYSTLGDRHYFADDPPAYPQNAQLDVLTPTQTKPVNVGASSSPDKFHISMRAPTQRKSSDFSILVGAKPASVVTLVEKSTGEYELDVNPPSQQSGGSYDLTVQTLDRDITIPKAIMYTGAATSNVDVILTIDSSPSMYPDCFCPPDNPNGEDRIGSAQVAAKTFVDLMNSGDHMGVVSFGGSAQIRYQLAEVNDSTRGQAKSAIDGIGQISATSIGAGLRAALNELTAHGDPSRPQAIVLLSDGFENSSPYADSVLPDIIANGVVVHAIGLGNTADANLLSRIVQQTGGTYTFAPSPQDLSRVYAAISATLAGEQTVFSQLRNVLQGLVDTVATYIDSSISEATFLINWGGSDLDLTLEAPDGTIINPSVAAIDPNIDFVSTATSEFYRVRSPQVGEWKLQTEGVVVDQSGGEPYLVKMTADSGLTLDINVDRTQYFVHDRIHIHGVLSDEQAITGAAVDISLTAASGLSNTLTLYDDGLHGDGQPADGVYANTSDPISQSGNTVINVTATGTSTSGEPFSRQATTTVFIAERDRPTHDLFVMSTASLTTTRPGEQVSYTINYGNLGPDTAENVVLSLTLPPEVSYISDSNGVARILPEGVVQWDLGTLSKDTTDSVSVTARISKTVPTESEATALAGISSLGGAIGDSPSNFDLDHENSVTAVTIFVTAQPQPLFLPSLQRATGPIRLTSNQGNNHTGSFSPDGTQTVFISDRDGNNEVYIMNVDGTEQHRLTQTPDIAEDLPSFSPDGSQIIFSGFYGFDDNAPAEDLYLMNADGSQHRNLTNTSDINEGRPHFSHDGTLITFDSDQTGNWEIYTAELQNGQLVNVQQVTNRPTFDDRLPSFSSTGSHILFRAEEVGQGIESSRIYVLELSSGSITKVSGDNADWFPAWSHDDQWIAFSSSRDTANRGIYLMRADGSNARLLTTIGTNDHPAISPDSSMLLFSSSREGSFNLYLLDLNLAPVANCVSDEFLNSSLLSDWTWTDPLGDSSYSLTDNPGSLRIEAPDGNRDLNVVFDYNAPRIMQAVSGDFDVTTKVTIDPDHVFQSAGLVAWFDEGNFVWVGRSVHDEITRLVFQDSQQLSGQGVSGINSTTVHLRIVRIGSTLSLYYSLDGVGWIFLISNTYPAAPSNALVGLFLINAHQDNRIAADFDYFRCTGES